MPNVEVRRVGEETGVEYPVLSLSDPLEEFKLRATVRLKLRVRVTRVFSSTGVELTEQNYHRHNFNNNFLLYVSCGEGWRPPGPLSLRQYASRLWTILISMAIGFAISWVFWNVVFSPACVG